jgi:DNA primase
MLSGGKGVHVVVPLTPGHDWGTHKDFARRFAEAMALAEPDRFTATMSKAKRKGRIFIDWLRNQRGSTAVLPYSARARQGAPVALPITWDELEGWTMPIPSIADADCLIERASYHFARLGLCRAGASSALISGTAACPPLGHLAPPSPRGRLPVLSLAPLSGLLAENRP